MQVSFKDKLSNYGQWTYRGAWILEITAALLGIATGVALSYQAFKTAEPDSVGSMDLVLASAPFFMVAIAELTKIPIATLLFSASWIWKPIIFVFLLGLAGITFETVSMGLERAVTLRQLRYDRTAKEIQQLKVERDQLSTGITDRRAGDEVTRAQHDFDLIAVQSDQEHQKIEAQIHEVEKEFAGNQTLSPEVSRVKELLDQKTKERDRITAERDSHISDAIKQFESQRESFSDRLKAALNSGQVELAKKIQLQLDALGNPRAKIEKDYAARISVAELEIGPIQRQYEDKLAALAPISSEQKVSIEGRIALLRQRLAGIDEANTSQMNKARDQIASALELQKDQEKQIVVDMSRKAEVEKTLAQKESERIELARTDQVGRIASRIWGVKPEEVNDDQAGLTSVIWFGSLALLAALAGPITAIVALALQRIAASGERLRDSKFQRLLRCILLTWRWRRVRSIKVRVEVPVEKEVEKRVNVPVETVVKEILYVPILTDDPDAVRRAIGESLPKEVADLVSISLAGAKSANSPQHSPA